MWYNDLSSENEQAADQIAAFFDISAEDADSILLEARARYARGSKGLPYSDEISGANDYRDLQAIEKQVEDMGVDTRDLAQLFHDAWKEGICRKDRVTLILDSQACDSVCTACGDVLANGAEECDHCGSTEIDHQVTVTASDPFAGVWADNDQSIGGSSWEDAGEGTMVYAILTARPDLATELAADGYKLDLSAY